MKILLATDGSSYSELAARTLVALRPPSSAEVTILHVKESPHYLSTPALPPAYAHEWHRVQHELQTEVQEAADRAVAQAEQILTGLECTLDKLVVEGNPADQIIRTGKELSVDLTVVASKGLTGSALFPLGSVAQKVKRYAPGSVLVTRSEPQADGDRMDRIMLATDGSENAMEAAEFLSLFALPESAKVTLLNVMSRPVGISPFSFSPAMAEELREARLEDARDLVEDTRKHLSTQASVVTAITEGDPAEQILKASSEMDADLVVIGSRGLSGAKLFLLGSVSERVVRYSETSVLLVKMSHSSASSGARPA